MSRREPAHGLPGPVGRPGARAAPRLAVDLNLTTHRAYKKRCLLELLAGRPLSRHDLALATNLSDSTVAILVDELIEEGLVTEIGPGPSRGGRRPILLDLCPDGAFLVGLEFAATACYGLVRDLKGRVVARLERRWPTPRGPDTVLTHLAEAVEELLAADPVLRARTLGVGVGVPGLVDWEAGIGRYYPHIPDWREVPVASILQARLGLPVFVEQNIRAVALAELRWGAGRGHQTLVCLGGRNGLGAAVVVGGELVRGVGAAAGEIGHITAEPGGPPCSCGRRGCLEAYVGPGAWQAELRARHLPEAAGPAALWAAAEAGEAQAVAFCRGVVGRLAAAVSHVVGLLNPSLVILAGYLAAAGPGLARELEAALRDLALPGPAQQVRVVQGQLGEAAGALGAADVVWRRLAPEYRTLSGGVSWR